MTTSDNKRLEWIDVARGVAILFVIIGHTVPFESFIRVIIYSIHMPIFFILSGYTFKCSNDYKSFSVHTYKGVLKFLLPCIFMQLACDIYRMKGVSGSLVNCFFETFSKILYGRNIEVLWFLIALFWGRIIFDGIQLIVKKHTWSVYICLCVFGILLGKTGIIFPQNFDLALVIPTFMWTGKVLKNNIETIEKNKFIIFTICFLVWLICVMNRMHIELAVRVYPMWIVSVIEAICGSMCFLWLCRKIKSSISGKISIIGKCSFSIFMVHNLGMNFLTWDKAYAGSGDIFGKLMIMCSRIILEVVISIFIVNAYSKIKRRIFHDKR